MANVKLETGEFTSSNESSTSNQTSVQVIDNFHSMCCITYVHSSTLMVYGLLAPTTHSSYQLAIDKFVTRVFGVGIIGQLTL